MTLTCFQGQNQGHANFDCEYLVNGDRESKYHYCRYVGSRLLAFEWCIYILLWLILIVLFNNNRNSISKNSIKVSHVEISQYVGVYAVPFVVVFGDVKRGAREAEKVSR